MKVTVYEAVEWPYYSSRDYENLSYEGLETLFHELVESKKRDEIQSFRIEV